MKKGIIPASILASLAGALALLVILLPKLQVAPSGLSLGSVTGGNEYFSSTTRNYAGTAMPNLTVLKPGPGALGSVVITGAAAGQMTFYDASTSVNGVAYPTTTLATFPLSTAAGTYTFDVNFNRGLLVEIITATPTSTITFR